MNSERVCVCAGGGGGGLKGGGVAGGGGWGRVMRPTLNYYPHKTLSPLWRVVKV